MSRPLDPVVPPALRAILDEDDLAAHQDFTVLLLTGRDDGWPHLAMLSVGEVVAVDERRLRLAVWPGSTSTANLAARGRATLAAVVAPTSYLLRCDVRPLGEVEPAGHARLAAFEAAVVAASADEAPYARLEAGVRFTLREPAPTRGRWAATRSALQEATA